MLLRRYEGSDEYRVILLGRLNNTHTPVDENSILHFYIKNKHKRNAYMHILKRRQIERSVFFCFFYTEFRKLEKIKLF